MVGRLKNIVFIGMMGSGKTTLGRCISEKMSKVFIDLDEYIENGEGMEIPEIFEKYGEEHFRNLEVAYAKDLSKRNDVVIATGGGVIKSEEAIGALRRGFVIWIDRPDDMIFDSIDTEKRPLIKANPKAFFDISAKRRPIYESVCDYHFLNDLDENEACTKLLSVIEKMQKDND